MTTTSLAITEKACEFIHAHVRHRRCTRQVYVRALRRRSPRSSSISQEESRKLCSSRLHFRPEFRDGMESSGRQQYIALAIPVVGQLARCSKPLVWRAFCIRRRGRSLDILTSSDMSTRSGEGAKANNCIRGMASKINMPTYMPPPHTEYLGGQATAYPLLLTKVRQARTRERSHHFFS